MIANGDGVVATDWKTCAHDDHLVQFYENDEFLVDTLSDFVDNALSGQHGAIVIATPAHRDALAQRLETLGWDVAGVARAGQYTALDAAATLQKFMIDGMPDEKRFGKVVGALMKRLSGRYPRVQAFGEMVALLWTDGNAPAALRLEALWNELAKKHAFILCCAYPIQGFQQHADGAPFLEVCAQHTRVVPAESYRMLEGSDQHFRAVAELQQKACALLTEVEEHKKTHAALKRREQELTDFVEQASQCMHQVGADGTILWANKAELTLLGYTADEYIGRNIVDFHADRATIDDILSRLLEGGALDDYPARLRCKDGSVRHVLIQSNGHWEGGKFINTRCFTRDVTDRMRLDEVLQTRLAELAEADRRKNEFLAMLGHELRNPLSPILAALEILRLPGADAAARGTAHDAIGHQTRHLARIVDDLLDVTRISSGKIRLRAELVEVSMVLARAVEMTRPLIDARRHRISISLPKASVLVNGDGTRLEQIFCNLLNNAAKYMNPNGEITLSAEVTAGEVAVCVADKGVGIGAELLPHVFDIFTQAERSLDRSLGGLGVGLWMVRKLAELHGGRISVHSGGQGKGCEFTVHLPLASMHDAASDGGTRPAVNVDAVTRPCRMMVVDDNRDGAEILAILLRMQGHVVQIAHDGYSALQMAATFNPEIILLDIGLPGLDGYAVAAELRKIRDKSSQCLVAMTGYGTDDDRQRSHEAGFDHHVVKPVDPAHLNELVARALAAMGVA